VYRLQLYDVNRTLVLALFVVSTLAFAGCSGSDPIETGQQDREPVEFPNGTNDREISDISTLIDYHWTVIWYSDYVAHVRYTGDSYGRDPDKYLRIQQETTIRSSRTDEKQIMHQNTTYDRGNSTSQNLTWYTEGTSEFVRTSGINRDGIERQPYFYVDRRFSDSGFVRYHVVSFSRVSNYHVYHKFFVDATPEYVETRRHDGHAFHVYSVSEGTTDTTGEVVVREDGLIKSLTINAVVDGETAQLSATVELRDEVSITTPEWKQDAERADRSGGGGGDYNCDDFSSQAAAQAAHENSGGAYGLDGDGDGIACEHLP